MRSRYAGCRSSGELICEFCYSWKSEKGNCVGANCTVLGEGGGFALLFLA
jgi:hypothetical protein